MDAARPSKPRLLLFAFGDFAFNLFWQSVMLFLLFYYTDALDIPIAVAATTYMIASVWDGIANFARACWSTAGMDACGTARSWSRARCRSGSASCSSICRRWRHGRAGQSRACSARICCSARPMRR